jgi:tRNA nucleotidyltransferase/poly(A) polymerase
MSAAPLVRAELSWMDWPAVVAVRSVLEEEGIAYAYVGGALRDSLIGRRPNDVDMVADAGAEALIRHFIKRGMLARMVSPSTKTVRVVFDSRTLDISSLDKPYITGNSFPEKVHAHLQYYCDITINTMALLSDDSWLDPHNGQADLMAGLVRLTPGAESQLPEHAVRILRLLRFHAIYGKQDISEHTVRVCRKFAHALHQSELPYILTQFFRWISVDRLMESLAAMRHIHLYPQIFPFPMHEQFALRRMQEVEALSGLRCDPGVRLVVLLHCTPLTPAMAFAAFSDKWDIYEANQKQIQALINMLPLADFSAIPPAIAMVELVGQPVAIGLLLLKWIQEPNVQAVATRYKRVLGAMMSYQPKIQAVS